MSKERQKKPEKKKNRDRGFFKTLTILLFLFIIFLVFSCSFINKKLGIPNDNPIEEFVEDIIEDKTGIILDLTPEDNHVDLCNDLDLMVH